MSSHYGIVFPEFWSGETGRAIRTDCGKDGQLVALYLMSAPSATMIGLFSLPLRDLQHHTGVGQKGLARAFGVLAALGFADYDGRSEHVWVREMAKFRLGLQKKSPLDPDDKRVAGIQRLYDKLTENPFLEPFFDRYAKELRLRGKRRSGRPVVPLLDVAPSKGLGRGFEGASKPVNRDQYVPEIRDQSTGIRDQGSGTGIRKSTAASRRPVENSVENLNGNPEDGVNGDVPAPVHHRKGTARTGPRRRRRGVEGSSENPTRAIGFCAPTPGPSEPGDVGSRTGDGENARPTTDTVAPARNPTAATGGLTAQSRGGESAPSELRSSGFSGSDPNDRRGERGASEPDTGSNQGLAQRAGGDHPSEEPREPGVDQNAKGVGTETPGQAELRRTIERLRRERTS